jgi:hypothetical protein
MKPKGMYLIEEKIDESVGSSQRFPGEASRDDSRPVLWAVGSDHQTKESQ